MKKLNLSLAAVFFSIILMAGTFPRSGEVFAEGTSPVTVQSKQSFDNTVSEIRTMVKKNGMMVLSEINQGKILSMTGLSVKAVSLFVGNPQIGNKLFSADHAVGLAVPVRLNVYEGTDGKTYINYVKPSDQLGSFNNKEIQMIAQKLDQKLAMLTGMLSK
ncbi:MAG: DUF302 domain-containing protein [Ignavibacteriaceae bacterium]|jgi:uncharacterized protein (DUF302 family)